MLELRWLTAVGLCTAAGLACGAGGCRREPAPPTRVVFDRPNIVLITLDTTRADHLGCYGYFRDTSPVIDGVARESIVFDRCIAPMATTLPAHASLFTGVYPIEHGVTKNINYGGMPLTTSEPLRSFVQMADAAGYETAAFVSATPLKGHSGMAAGFDVFVEPPGSQWPAEEPTTRAMEWLATAPAAPYLLWVHYYDPHMPYDPPEGYRSFRSEPALTEFLAAREIPEVVPSKTQRPVAAAGAANRYDGEIRYMDGQIGVLLTELRKRSDSDRTILIVLADHGEGLCQHDWVEHGSIWDEQLRVALMIRVPGEAPRRVAGVLSIVDVLATVLGWVAEGPFTGFRAQASGCDVLRSARREASAFSQRKRTQGSQEELPAYALTTDTWKFVHEIGGADLLFDLRADPYELNNVIGEHEAVAAQLRDLVLRTIAGQQARGKALQAGRDADGSAVDAAVVRQLKSLGYIDDEDEDEHESDLDAGGS